MELSSLIISLHAVVARDRSTLRRGAGCLHGPVRGSAGWRYGVLPARGLAPLCALVHRVAQPGA